MTTNTPTLPTDPRPLAVLATTRHTPVREMTALLTRYYGPGLIVTTTGNRTTWSLATTRPKGTLRP